MPWDAIEESPICAAIAVTMLLQDSGWLSSFFHTLLLLVLAGFIDKLMSILNNVNALRHTDFDPRKTSKSCSRRPHTPAVTRLFAAASPPFSSCLVNISRTLMIYAGLLSLMPRLRDTISWGEDMPSIRLSAISNYGQIHKQAWFRIERRHTDKTLDETASWETLQRCRMSGISQCNWTLQSAVDKHLHGADGMILITEHFQKIETRWKSKPSLSQIIRNPEVSLGCERAPEPQPEQRAISLATTWAMKCAVIPNNKVIGSHSHQHHCKFAIT